MKIEQDDDILKVELVAPDEFAIVFDNKTGVLQLIAPKNVDHRSMAWNMAKLFAIRLNPKNGDNQQFQQGMLDWAERRGLIVKAPTTKPN